jgi:hypothetical protein
MYQTSRTIIADNRLKIKESQLRVQKIRKSLDILEKQSFQRSVSSVISSEYLKNNFKPVPSILQATIPHLTTLDSSAPQFSSKKLQQL